MRVLHSIGSPKAEDSTSTRIALAFLDAYPQAHPDHELTTLDVWTEELPRFGRELATAKLAPLMGEQRTPRQEEAWQTVETVIANFASHDKIVISTPMWNFGLP